MFAGWRWGGGGKWRRFGGSARLEGGKGLVGVEGERRGGESTLPGELEAVADEHGFAVAVLVTGEDAVAGGGEVREG